MMNFFCSTITIKRVERIITRVKPKLCFERNRMHRKNQSLAINTKANIAIQIVRILILIYQVFRTDLLIDRCALVIVDCLEPKASAGTTAVIPSVDDKLQRIQVYDDRLFACYEVDYLLIFRFSDAGTYNYEHIITVKYKDGESTPIDAFVVYEDQLWVATGNILHVFNVNNSTNNNFYNLMMKRPIEDDQLTTMVGCSDHVWAGSLKGKIYLFLMNNCELYKTFDGHNDTVFCLASMFDTHVISGAGRKDRSIAIWDKGQATHVEQASGSLSRTRSTTITAQNLPRRMTLTSDSAQ